MARRGDKINAFNALQGLAELSELTPASEEIAQEESGSGVTTLSIRNIFPDPVQARRVLPVQLRKQFLAGDLSPIEALQDWQQLATDDELEAEVLDTRVVRLAKSLQAQEQINPITVCRTTTGDVERFIIETGERRWWAHWWLLGIEGVDRFESVQAVIVEQASPWRQAAENLQGEPLSAVQEACQVARLFLLEVGIEPNFSIAWQEQGPSVELGETGYGFYRQALAHRAPRGAWARIEEATGKGTRYCQYLLDLLRLDDVALDLADRASLTEGQLRPLASSDADAQRQERIVGMMISYELSRDRVAGLVGESDLDQVERKLQGKTKGKPAGRKTPAIRPPEQIVLARLSSMTRLLDRATRSEPAVLDVIAREISLMDTADDRRVELQNLHTFLGDLLDLLPSASDT